ncbi:MAG: alpha/beta hydrolase [Allomuricauda sp.]|nr:MAG: alpha/beta hydrolase [Allomuricauda sp.]
MKRILFKLVKVLAVVLGLMVVVFLLGPKVEQPSLDQKTPEVPADLRALEQQIAQHEAAVPNIKSDNEARIIWFDSIPQKTAYSIVYLHGWSASQEEGDPVHTETAKRYGCNLYLPRLAGHGITEEEPMLELTAETLLESAEEALAVGKQLGEKVILMGTSTGGTLALHLAKNDPDVAALLLYSPNIEIFDPNAKFMSGPWGLQVLRAVKGSDYHEFDTDIDLKNQYWTTKYRIEALTHLQALLDVTMTEEAFAAVTQPVFMGYYYKDDIHQDSVVSVPAMLEMFDDLGTPLAQKEKVAFPEAGDHVMTSYISSKDVASVRKETNAFLEDIVGLKK